MLMNRGEFFARGRQKQSLNLIGGAPLVTILGYWSVRRHATLDGVFPQLSGTERSNGLAHRLVEPLVRHDGVRKRLNTKILLGNVRGAFSVKDMFEALRQLWYDS